jgi:hypothetical protein
MCKSIMSYTAARKMNPGDVGFRWNGAYWAALTIDESGGLGRKDVYFGPVGADPHHHSWLKWTDGQLSEIGARLKDPLLYERPPSYQTTSMSTATLARFRACWDPERRCVTTEVADVFSGSAYTATPAESARTASKRGVPMIDVTVPPQARVLEGELAYCYTRSTGATESLSTQQGYLPVSSDNSLGIAVLITKWE